LRKQGVAKRVAHLEKKVTEAGRREKGEKGKPRGLAAREKSPL